MLREAAERLRAAKVCALCKKPEPDTYTVMPVEVHAKCLEDRKEEIIEAFGGGPSLPVDDSHA